MIILSQLSIGFQFCRPYRPPPRIHYCFDFQWRIQDFLQGVRQLPNVLLFFKFFAENRMKMKEFGPGGGVPGAPLGSANEFSLNCFQKKSSILPLSIIVDISLPQLIYIASFIDVTRGKGKICRCL